MCYNPKVYWEERFKKTKGGRKFYSGKRIPYFVYLFRRFYIKLIAKILFEYTNKNIKSCLDVGCGTGSWISFLEKRGLKVTGIDICSSAIEKCKKLYPNHSFKNLKAEELNYDDNAFDLIFSFGSLQHINYENQIIAINKMKKIAKNNILIIEMANLSKKKYGHLFPHTVNDWEKFFDLKVVKKIKLGNYAGLVFEK